MTLYELPVFFFKSELTAFDFRQVLVENISEWFSLFFLLYRCVLGFLDCRVCFLGAEQNDKIKHTALGGLF